MVAERSGDTATDIGSRHAVHTCGIPKPRTFPSLVCHARRADVTPRRWHTYARRGRVDDSSPLCRSAVRTVSRAPNGGQTWRDMNWARSGDLRPGSGRVGPGTAWDLGAVHMGSTGLVCRVEYGHIPGGRPGPRASTPRANAARLVHPSDEVQVRRTFGSNRPAAEDAVDLTTDLPVEVRVGREFIDDPHASGRHVLCGSEEEGEHLVGDPYRDPLIGTDPRYPFPSQRAFADRQPPESAVRAIPALLAFHCHSLARRKVKWQ